MTALIDDLQFGGPNESVHEQDGASKNGRLTFPVNMIHSNKKNEKHQLYLDLERIQSNDAGPNGANEIDNFFDQNSRLAPSQINFNEFDMDLLNK